MDQILSLVTQYTDKRHEDDFIDRLNFQYTSYVFALSALIIGYNTYFGTAISCWTPAEFKKGWVEYTRDYCLIENTYYVPIEDPNMPPERYREERELTYYQWVQFILVFLAFLFYLPYLYWSTVNWWSGLQVKAVVDEACKLDKTDVQSREKQIERIANHLKKYIDRQGRKSPIPFIPNAIGRNWVSFNYVLTKALFVVNLMAQMILIHFFLGFDIDDFLSLRVGFGSNWIANGIFPRQTMCDFEVRKKGSIQKYSVQCVLSMNMLNEKIFLALFYWLLALLLLTIWNLVSSFEHFFRDSSRKAFVSRMLSAGGHGSTDDDAGSQSDEKVPLVERPTNYTNDYNRALSINRDVVVVLHLIAKNAGDNVCQNVVSVLFKKLSEKSQ
ncbi:CRE-INX-15 protein [Caenorhabditis remanei]|uniref:Innexin n=1 Tax=Caenorhabditis remanei TaxID=31234 RepID=E3MGD6_CAERE|nr:CRE-INX-15 protein [Caenorhabditis remanei]